MKLEGGLMGRKRGRPPPHHLFNRRSAKKYKKLEHSGGSIGVKTDWKKC